MYSLQSMGKAISAMKIKHFVITYKKARRGTKIAVRHIFEENQKQAIQRLMKTHPEAVVLSVEMREEG